MFSNYTVFAPEITMPNLSGMTGASEFEAGAGAGVRTDDPESDDDDGFFCTALRDEALAGGERMQSDQLKRREFITLLGARRWSFAICATHYC
jgi:hypothetical protein